jgi:hypothetical protein
MDDTTAAAGNGSSARRRNIRVVVVVALALGTATALGACSNGASNKGSSSAASATSFSPRANDAIAKSGAPKGRPLSVPREVIYTADLQVRVDRLSPATARAVAIVDGAGGYLFSEDASLTGHTDATLVFKVPPARFTSTLGQLAALGTPLAKNVNANDVTAQVVDLRGRIKTAATSVARLRNLLATAQNVPDVVAIENGLTARESELESLQGQLQVVTSQVQLATVTVVLTTSAPRPHHAGIPGFASAVGGGWDAFANTAKVAAAVVGAVLPFAVFAGLAGGAIVVVRRRRRSTRLVAP